MIVEQLIAPVSGLLDKFIPDADQKAKLAHEIATLSEKQLQEIMLQQIELVTSGFADLAWGPWLLVLLLGGGG